MSKAIENFFDNIISYIEMIVNFLGDDSFAELLLHLWWCLPELVRGILILTILLTILLGFVNAFSGR